MTVPGRMTMALALLVLPVLVTACGHGGRAAVVPAPVTMALCGGGPQVRPSVVEIVCETDDITAGHLTWSGWGNPVATAVGTAVVDTCAYEDCHTGSFASVPIVVVASKVAGCARAYGRLQYVFPGGSPFPALPANEKFSAFIAAPGRPAPPADQTVSLTC
jgi:hypothetical protein